MIIPDLNDDDGIIAFALDMWGNYIETFSVSMSAKDMKDREYKMTPKDFIEPNSLTTKQKQLVKRIRQLSEQYRQKMNEKKSMGEKK